jgi:dipeptide/tripeptide permease
MPSGANTDLLGRRWFLVGGNVFCFIGHLVVATAKGNKSVIVGMGLSFLTTGSRLYADLA